MEKTLQIQIKTAELPQTVHGLTTQQAGAYTIYINEDQTQDEQAAAFLHECLHIYHDDFNSTRTAGELEEERHAELKRIFAQEATAQ